MSDKIPDSVRSMIRLHAANTDVKIVKITNELDRTPVITSRSRMLRRYREQLVQELDAWNYLLGIEQLVRDPDPDTCAICYHSPHDTGSAPSGRAGATGRRGRSAGTRTIPSCTGALAIALRSCSRDL